MLTYRQDGEEGAESMEAKRAQRIIDAHFTNAEAVGASGKSHSLTIYYIVNGNENSIHCYDVTAADLEMGE